MGCCQEGGLNRSSHPWATFPSVMLAPVLMSLKTNENTLLFCRKRGGSESGCLSQSFGVAHRSLVLMLARERLRTGHWSWGSGVGVRWMLFLVALCTDSDFTVTVKCSGSAVQLQT